MMLAMVAVGAMAIVLLLRTPCLAMDSRTGVQSICELRSTVRLPPRSCSSNSIVSMGSNPRDHLEPS